MKMARLGTQPSFIQKRKRKISFSGEKGNRGAERRHLAMLHPSGNDLGKGRRVRTRMQFLSRCVGEKFLFPAQGKDFPEEESDFGDVESPPTTRRK